MAGFFRPEAMRSVRRWAETATYVAAFALLLAFILSWTATALWLKLGIAAVVALVGMWIVRSAALSALGQREGEAPGIVTIDERRISYFGPHIGGVVSLNDLRSIEVATAAPNVWQYETQWILRWSETEPALVIPISAKGAAGLMDAFAALPGFAPTRALSALSAAPDSTITIWQRQTLGTRAALEHAPPRA